MGNPEPWIWAFIFPLGVGGFGDVGNSCWCWKTGGFFCTCNAPLWRMWNHRLTKIFIIDFSLTEMWCECTTFLMSVFRIAQIFNWSKWYIPGLLPQLETCVLLLNSTSYWYCVKWKGLLMSESVLLYKCSIYHFIYKKNANQHSPSTPHHFFWYWFHQTR